MRPYHGRIVCFCRDRALWQSHYAATVRCDKTRTAILCFYIFLINLRVENIYYCDNADMPRNLAKSVNVE